MVPQISKNPSLKIIEAKTKGIINKSLTFRCQARLDFIDDRLLNQMKKAGFIRLLLGIETLSPKLLKNDLNKGGAINNMSADEIDKKIQTMYKSSKIMVYRTCRVKKFNSSGEIKIIKFKLPYFLRCKYAIIKAAENLGYI